jgi:hypothetical protein
MIELALDFKRWDITQQPQHTLIAKLTPLGRQLLVTSNNTLITSFSLGDSDANYNALLPLTTKYQQNLGIINQWFTK